MGVGLARRSDGSRGAPTITLTLALALALVLTLTPTPTPTLTLTLTLIKPNVLQESVASELASRMQAMQSATDNAKDLQNRLETEMNRARQAKITQELMEIIAGADATN